MSDIVSAKMLKVLDDALVASLFRPPTKSSPYGSAWRGWRGRCGRRISQFSVRAWNWKERPPMLPALLRNSTGGHRGRTSKECETP